MSFRALFRRCTALLALFLMPTLASAQNNFDLDMLNPGEILVNLSAVEQTEVEQDTLHGQLYYSAQGRDRVALQDEVNRVMASALELLADSEVESATQVYRVYPITPNRPTRGDIDNPLWRAQQGVSLTSQDSAALLDLVADLQDLGLTMSGLNYSLSPEREEEVADSLMGTALDKLRTRAEAAAANLGKSGVEILEISMNSSNNGFFAARSTAMMSMEAMDVATPVAEPGLTTVMFNVSARVVLLP
ncbi:MAG: SIMPL domain-containing protein [Gammaproteobacteria bacterium]